MNNSWVIEWSNKVSKLTNLWVQIKISSMHIVYIFIAHLLFIIILLQSIYLIASINSVIKALLERLDNHDTKF